MCRLYLFFFAHFIYLQDFKFQISGVLQIFCLNIAFTRKFGLNGAECSAGYYWVLHLIELTLHLCNASIRTLNLKLLEINSCGSTAITCLAAAYIANSAVQYTPWKASDALSLTF